MKDWPSERVKAVDLPASAFPFRMQVLNAETREILANWKITGPGVLPIPGRDTWKVPTAMRFIYPGGEIYEYEPEEGE